MEREKIVMIVAVNIQTAMADKGMNPSELARAAGLNATGIYDILSGKSRSPRLDTIGKIADALGVPIAALFSETSRTDLKSQIIDVIDGLPSSECERLLLIARSLSGAQTT